MDELKNEMMLMLGTMQSDIKHIRAQTELTSSTLSTVEKTLVKAEMNNESAHRRLDAIEPRVEQNTTFRNKQMGIVAAISFVISLIGSGLFKIMQVF